MIADTAKKIRNSILSPVGMNNTLGSGQKKSKL